MLTIPKLITPFHIERAIYCGCYPTPTDLRTTSNKSAGYVAVVHGSQPDSESDDDDGSQRPESGPEDACRERCPIQGEYRQIERPARPPEQRTDLLDEPAGDSHDRQPTTRHPRRTAH